VIDSTPKISVIIPHFNRVELLEQTLESVKRQTIDAWEVIVVDDGSEPDQLRRVYALEACRIRVIQRKAEPKGPSMSRNTGLKHARGEHVMFVDSDDLLAPWCLENRQKTAEQHPEKSFWVFPVMLFRQTMGDLRTLWNELDGTEDLERFLHSDPPWHTSSPLWNRRDLLKLGGFNAEVMYGDDSDLHIRAMLNNLPYAKFTDALPDSFVRRDNTPRITNSTSEPLLRSRQIRLVEGSKTLKNAGARLQSAWEGQYFSEAEFLLFNVSSPAPHIKSVLAIWKQNHVPGWARSALVRTYLRIALMTQKHAYIVLRLARRISMLGLPTDYFPVAPRFQNTLVSNDVYRRLSERIPEMKAAANGGIDERVSA
jgi:glycosyltransferase involved in cell wall biosynthesis